MLRIKDGFAGQRAVIIPPAVVSELENHPLSAALHVTDIGFYPNASHHYRRRDTPISQYVFIYAVKGRGWYELDGKHYEVVPGSYFILLPGEPHVYGADDSDPWTIYWIHFKGTLASGYVNPGPGPFALRLSPDQSSGNLIPIFDEIMSVLDAGYGRENLLYSTSLLHHFLGSLSYRRLSRDCGGAGLDPNRDVVALAVKFMSDNIDKRLSLSDISDHLGYSPSHLSALFSRVMGASPVAFFHQLKIKRACSLLDFTTLRVNQICHMIGIDDPYYFSRMFTRVMGRSPRSYRAIKKG